MLKNRPIMMLLTGLGLAFVLWALVSRLQTEKPETARVEQSQPVAVNVAVNEDYMITPPSVLSVRQIDTGFVLVGTGVAGAGLSLLHGEHVLSTTKMDENGDWDISLSETNLTDIAEINLLMTTPDGRLVRSDQSLLLITGQSEVAIDTKAEVDPNMAPSNTQGAQEMRPQELGPQETLMPYEKRLILLLAPGAHSRVLQTPFERLPEQDGFVLEAIDYDNSGGVIFSGLSLRQGKVRIYANDNLVGESRVDMTGRWSLIFGNILPMGTYNIGVELVSDTGRDPIALTLPFERMAPMFETENSSKVLVERLEDRIQVGRALYGGGYQFTVVYGPLALVE